MLHYTLVVLGVEQSPPLNPPVAIPAIGDFTDIAHDHWS
jgi:hypothetical protein